MVGSSGSERRLLLTGASGVGKSSLLRAGVLPQIKLRGVACRYVDVNRLSDEALPAVSAATASGLLVLDDVVSALEDSAKRERLFDLLRRADQVAALKVLYVVDDEELWKLDVIERQAGAVAPAARFRLENLDQERVADIIERTVLAGGAYFEGGLAKEMAADLAREGSVSPSRIQIVAGTAVALKVVGAKAFHRLGGSDVFTWRFCHMVCQAAGGRKAERVLAEVAATAPRVSVSLDRIAHAAGLDDKAAGEIVHALGAQHVLRPAPGGYTLGSEWLRPILGTFTGETRARGVGARLALRRKMVSGGLLSPRELRDVWRFGGALKPDEERLVGRSIKIGGGALCVALAVPLLILFGSYFRYGHSVTFDAHGGPGASVVVRLGKQSGPLSGLPHHPPFGAPIAEPGFLASALENGPPSGTAPTSGWLHPLIAALRPLPRALSTLILEGNAQPLVALYADPTLRPSVIDALAAAGRGSDEERKLIQNALADSSEEVRRRAVVALSAIEQRTPGSSGGLLETATRDESAAVRALAFDTIAQLPPDRATAIWSQLLDARDAETRRRALEALRLLSGKYAETWTAIAHGVLGATRSDVLSLLGPIMDPGQGGVPENMRDAHSRATATAAAAKVLLVIALDGKAPANARIEALKLLRGQNVPKASLEKISGSPRLLMVAAPLLLKDKPDEAQAKVKEALNGPVPMRVAAAAAIGLLPRTADTPKLLKLFSYDRSAEVRAEATRSLPALGRESVPLLVKEAKSGGADVERAAVETLAAHASQLGVGQVIDALESAIKGTRQSTRRAAILAIGRVGTQKPAQAASVLGILLHDKVADVRTDAASALGELMREGVKEAIGALRGAAKDPDPQARRSAAEAFGQVRGPLAQSAAKSLSAFVQDSDASVRAMVAQSFGELGPGAASESALIALISDREPSVRAAARRAAGKAGVAIGVAASSGSRATAGGNAKMDAALLQSFASASTADRAETAALAARAGALQTLGAALRDVEPSVRKAAVDNAGNLGSQGASLLAVALTDDDVAIRASALRSLVQAKATSVLIQASRAQGGVQGTDRARVLEALGDLGGPDAFAALCRGLEAGSEGDRVAAARGLSRVHSVGKVSPTWAELTVKLESALLDPARDVREAASHGLARLWATEPAESLRHRLADELHPDARFAAAAALAAQASGKDGAGATKVLQDVAQKGPLGAQLAARIGSAFVGRPDAMTKFVHVIRYGD